MMDQALARGSPFGLALLDAHLEGMGGFDLARQLGADPRHARTRCFLLIAAGMRGDAQHCQELGLDTYLTKPVSLAELRETLESVSGRPSGQSGFDASPDAGNDEAPLRVLLAEDNLVNQKLAVKLLEKQGHVATVAENGRLALEVLEQGGYDLILMDMMMPEMDGLEATRRIRARERETRRPRIPIVAMTANAMRGDEERCREAGMDGYVSKPIQQGILFKEINRVLSASARESHPHAGTGPTIRDGALPVYDRADALSRIAGDEELLETLIDMFRNDAPGYLEEIQSALSKGEMADALRAAHTLKGVLATFSARRAESRVRHLEQLASAGNAAACGELLPSVKAEVEAFLQAIG